jgi:hypothetical protein
MENEEYDSGYESSEEIKNNIENKTYLKNYRKKYIKKIGRLFSKEYNKLCKIDINYNNIYDEISMLNNIDISDLILFRKYKPDILYQLSIGNKIINNNNKIYIESKKSKRKNNKNYNFNKDIKFNNSYEIPITNKNDNNINYAKQLYGIDIVKEYKYSHINNYIYKKCFDCNYKLDKKNKYDRCPDCYIYYKRSMEVFNNLLNKVKGIKSIFKYEKIFFYKRLYNMYIKNEI